MDWNFGGIESLSRSCKMRNRLADCRKTQNVVIPFTVNVHGEPRHAAWRGISLFLSFRKGEIPHFVRNDNQKLFFRVLLVRLTFAVATMLALSPALSAQTAARPETAKSKQSETSAHTPDLSGLWAPRPDGIRINTWDSSDPFGQKPELARSEEHTSELQSHLNLVCR